MLQTTITDLEQVPAKYQAFYTSSEEGGVYTIDSELQQPDISGLKETNADLKDEKRSLKTELDTIKQTLQDIQTNATEEKLLEKEEYTTLLTEKETSFKNDLTKANTELEELKRNLISSEIASIAQEIAGENGALLAPHLVGLEFEDGVTFPDNQTREDFIQSIKDNPLYAPLTNLQKASGGGATTTGSGVTHTNEANLEGYFNPNSSTYSQTKQYEIQQENPDLYSRLEERYGLNDPYNIKQHTKG